MSGYRYVLDEAVVEMMAAQPEEEQRIWLQIFRTLAGNPFVRGEWHTTDPTGRVLETKVMDDLAVTYWADHAVKEVRIVEVV